MADTKASGGGGPAACNERCGCPTPCPGGAACGCKYIETTATGDDHNRCSCGEHCGCNPCTCSNTVTGTGKAFCNCATGCTCATCAS